MHATFASVQKKLFMNTANNNVDYPFDNFITMTFIFIVITACSDITETSHSCISVGPEPKTSLAHQLSTMLGFDERKNMQGVLYPNWAVD